MRATHLAAPAPAAVFVQALLWGALLLFYSGDAAAPADGADPPQVLALTETDGAAALPALEAHLTALAPLPPPARGSEGAQTDAAVYQ